MGGGIRMGDGKRMRGEIRMGGGKEWSAVMGRIDAVVD